MGEVRSGTEDGQGTAALEWSYRRALKDPRLATLLFGVVVSAIGEGMLLVALPVQALKIHGGVPAAIAISLAAAAPYVMSTCLAVTVSLGRLRLPLRSQLVADCLFRGATLCLLGLASIGEQLGLAILLILLLVGSSLRSLATSALRLAATGIVGAEGRFAANGLLATTRNFSLYVVGPVLGGVVTASAGPGWVLLCNGISFVALLVVVVVAVPARTARGSDEPRPSSGLVVLKSRPIAWRLLLIVFAFNLLYMPVETALPLLVKDFPGSGAGALGVIWTGFGIGALAGALGTNYLRSIPRRPLLIGIIAFWGGIMLVLAMSPNVVMATIVFVCAGIGYAPFTPVAFSYIQSCLSGPEEQPVITFWVTITALAAPLGLAAAGPLVNTFGPRGGLVASALATITLALISTRVLRSTVPTIRASEGTTHNES